MDASHFSALVSSALHNKDALKALMEMALGSGFMARLARKELNKIGILVGVDHDSPSQAADVR